MTPGPDHSTSYNNGQDRARIRTLIRGFSRRYPLTLFGTLLFIAGFIMLGTGLLNSDTLTSAGGVSALALVIIMATGQYFIPATGLMKDIQWNSSADLRAGISQRSHSLMIRRWTLPPFYRLHMNMKSHLTAESRVLYRGISEYRLEDSSSLDIELQPPLPGTLYMHGEFYIKDLFGISRRSLEEPVDRQCTVLPAEERMGEIRFISSRSTEEDNSQARKSDQEKIFIRDYQPGDLARDINWKASGRINKLLTRIPPESEAKTRLIRMLVLSESRGRDDEAGYQFQLARLKALVSGFLSGLHRDFPDYKVELYLNEKLRELTDGESFTAAGRALSDWLPPHRLEAGELPLIDGPLMVFSHSLCHDLFRWTREYPAENLSMFLVQGCRPDAEDCESLRLVPDESAPGGFYPMLKPAGLKAPVLTPGRHSYDLLKEFPLRCLI